MKKLYQCCFIDEFSQKKIIICDLPTNNPIEILDIINDYGLNHGFKFMAVINSIIEINEQLGFKDIRANSEIIKYYHE